MWQKGEGRYGILFAHMRKWMKEQKEEKQMTLLEELKARGLVEAVTDPEIEKLLETPQTVYCGFDPSAASLQAGNLVSIMVLRRFQQAGHKVIALVGGATGLIGDPSGKSAERNMLTVEQVEENKKGIRENLSRILDFDGPNAAILVDNYDWYKGTSAIEFLRDIAINFRVPQMLAKESVKKRLEASEGALTFTEFSYQILQGNDFLHLFDTFGCAIEVGGADQWGNITAGTDLVHRMRGKTAYGLTFPLLLDSTGKKFGKSEGNALFLNGQMTSVYDWYQYFLRAADADVIRYLKVFSMRPLDEIAALEAQMKANPEARIPRRFCGGKERGRAGDDLQGREERGAREGRLRRQARLHGRGGRRDVQLARRRAPHGAAGRALAQRREDRREPHVCGRRLRGRPRGRLAQRQEEPLPVESILMMFAFATGRLGD